MVSNWFDLLAVLADCGTTERMVVNDGGPPSRLRLRRPELEVFEGAGEAAPSSMGGTIVDALKVSGPTSTCLSI